MEPRIFTFSFGALAYLLTPLAIMGAVAPATAPTTAPTTGPATAPADAVAQRHKDFDPRWRQMHDNLLRNNRRWVDSPITQTFTLDALIHFSLNDGAVDARVAELADGAQVRVAVEGSPAIWTLARTRAGGFNRTTHTPNLITRLDRYDFEADDEEIWSSTAMIGDQFIRIFAQSLYTNSSLSQNSAGITLQASELEKWGQPQKVLCAVTSKSLMQMRAEHPEEFRIYATPLLARYSDLEFLLPGSADVYTVFEEIPADQAAIASIAELLPQLDAPDPDQRDAASAKLRQLGCAGIIAALRWDRSGLSDEQNLRLDSFIFGFRRRPIVDAAIRRHDLQFLIDCLEYNDAAIRGAAKSELEKQIGRPIEFDAASKGNEASRVIYRLRAQLLVPPPVPPAGSGDAAGAAGMRKG